MKKFNVRMFCSDLVEIRKKNGMSQNDLSNELCINRSTLSLIENGKQMPDLDLLNKICSITGKNPGDYFVDDYNDGLIYLMGTLNKEDKVKIEELIERIKVIEKYEILAKRCLDGSK